MAESTSDAVFIKCHFCEKTFTQNGNRKKHEIKFHGRSIGLKRPKPKTELGLGLVLPLTEAQSEADNKGLLCTYCGKVFSNPSNKKIHVQTFHTEKPTNNDNLKCSYCGKVFSNPTNKKVHVRKMHKDEASEAEYDLTGKTVIKCNECNAPFPNLTSYRGHLLQIHNIPVSTVNHQFSSNEEFLAWKDSMEMDERVNYTSHRGWYNTSEGKKNVFYCRRSGIFRTRVDDASRKRAFKSQGSSKLGYYCTSTIEVVKSGGKLLVTFYPDHRDHGQDFTSQVHMNIPKSQKDKIADMIAQGMEYEEILERVREEAAPGSRTSFIEKKDIHNICAQYGKQEEEHYQQRYDYVEKIMHSLSEVLIPSIKEVKDIEVLKILHNDIEKMINTIKYAIKYPEDAMAAMKHPENNELCVDTSTSNIKYPADAVAAIKHFEDNELPSNESAIKNYVIQDHVYTTKQMKQEEGDSSTLRDENAKTKLEIAETLLKFVPILPKSAFGNDHNYRCDTVKERKQENTTKKRKQENTKKRKQENAAKKRKQEEDKSTLKKQNANSKLEIGKTLLRFIPILPKDSVGHGNNDQHDELKKQNKIALQPMIVFLKESEHSRKERNENKKERNNQVKIKVEKD